MLDGGWKIFVWGVRDVKELWDGLGWGRKLSYLIEVTFVPWTCSKLFTIQIMEHQEEEESEEDQDEVGWLPLVTACNSFLLALGDCGIFQQRNFVINGDLYSYRVDDWMYACMLIVLMLDCNLLQ